jgi:uncharacterized membrane protein YjgN (DUF898 family)
VIGFGAYLVVFLIILLPMIRSMTQATMEGRTVPPPSSFLFNLIFFYLFAILISALIQQFIYTRINNYSWNESQLGDVKFESSLELAPLLGIRITNILAIIFSLGLAIPWARVRHARYVLEHLALTTRGDLDNFTADVAVPEGALGEAAADFFDIDIGL